MKKSSKMKLLHGRGRNVMGGCFSGGSPGPVFYESFLGGQKDDEAVAREGSVFFLGKRFFNGPQDFIREWGMIFRFYGRVAFYGGVTGGKKRILRGRGCGYGTFEKWKKNRKCVSVEEKMKLLHGRGHEN